MKEIKIKISADGSSVETTVQGVRGPSCQEVTKSLINALGMVEKSEKLPEYYLVDEAVVHNHGV